MEKMRSRGGTTNTSSKLLTLHQRLVHALSLGTTTRVSGEKVSKWQCADIEIQRHVVRSIASFLDCISGDNVQHPLVKDSLADIVGALVWILQNKSKTVMSITTNLVVKLVKVIPSVLLQSYLLDLVHPLSSLLSFYQVDASISCAVALNVIFLNLNVKREREVWDVLIKTDAVSHIVSGIKDFSHGAMSIEYFQEMTSLLSTILHHWPSSRYHVWNDAELLKVLDVKLAEPDFSVKHSVLKLYSALALCGNGAKELLKKGEALLHMMVICMGRSHPFSLRTEGFRLAQLLATNEQECLKMMSLCCKPVVSAVINGMSGWISNSGKIANDEMSLLVEACHLALMINRWPGEHHDLMWELGIDKVLVGLLVDSPDRTSKHSLSLHEQISVAQEGLKTNFLLGLRPYVWDLLGWLTTHYKGEFCPNLFGHELKIDFLVTCACVSFVDSVRQLRQICLYDVTDTFRLSVSRAILKMITSPSKYVASKARTILYEILKPTSEEYVNYLLSTLKIRPSKDNLGIPYVLRTSINLVALVCYSGFSQYQCYVVENGGIKTLLGLVRWCLSNKLHIRQLSLAPHLCNRFSDRICCWADSEDWDGNDILLLYSLWGIAELVHSGCLRNHAEIFVGQADYSEAQFINTLQDICSDLTSPGIKWCAAFILSYFGIYGFPCKLGKRIGKAFNANEYADMKLIVSNRCSMNVHGILLAVRCPSLLPPEEFLFHKKTIDDSSVAYDQERMAVAFQREIHLSSHVDDLALTKILEFVYLGYLNAGEELVKKVKILAKRCSLQPLLKMLGRKHPTWGTPFPKYDLSPGLAQAKQCFSDIILEAIATDGVSWACSACSHSVPHMHAHRVVLWSSCDYLRALFQSGMVESYSQTIKVPISWAALVKLVNWFYTDELPRPPSGCAWDNMGTEERLELLRPYVELCWLGEIWFLDYIQDVSYRIVVSYLDSARQLSISMIKIATDFSQWKLVEVTANYLAPSYRQLCHTGDLEGLDEDVVDLIRAASVRLSQEG